MKNPWTKKNPFLSMWLSAANTIAGATRGHAAAEAKRQAAGLATRSLNELNAMYFGKGRRRTTRKKKSR
jgi:hypothetical protein